METFPMEKRNKQQSPEINDSVGLSLGKGNSHSSKTRQTQGFVFTLLKSDGANMFLSKYFLTNPVILCSENNL